MRIKISFTPNTEPLINNQKIVNGFIHKCLGKNNKYHNSVSDYTISNLEGGVFINGGRDVNFPNGGFIVVSSLKEDFIGKVINGLHLDGNLGKGMKVNGIDYISGNFYSGYNHFKTLRNGILLKTKLGFLTLKDSGFEKALEEQTRSKFSKINKGLSFKDFKIEIGHNNKSNRTINVYVNNIRNKSSYCPLTIYGDRSLIEHIYNYGLGNSTGSGFGTLIRTDNISKYHPKEELF